MPANLCPHCAQDGCSRPDGTECRGRRGRDVLEDMGEGGALHALRFALDLLDQTRRPAGRWPVPQEGRFGPEIDALEIRYGDLLQATREAIP